MNECRRNVNVEWVFDWRQLMKERATKCGENELMPRERTDCVLTVWMMSCPWRQREWSEQAKRIECNEFNESIHFIQFNWNWWNWMINERSGMNLMKVNAAGKATATRSGRAAKRTKAPVVCMKWTLIEGSERWDEVPETKWMKGKRN